MLERSKIDVVIGIQNGDEAKGKITYQKLQKTKYDCVLRFNGGGNAGHTIYKNKEKIVTHFIPCGVLQDVLSVIGNGCVLNIKSFFEEVEYLKNKGFDTTLIKIATNTHIITDEHKKEDVNDTKIGTTKTGNGPAYRDKYNRTGLRAESCSELQPYLINLYDLIHGIKPLHFLAEGAQAYGLDIDWGDYPFVTSSHCGIGSVLLNGFNHKHINEVIGVIKAYETYVGNKKFEPDEPVFQEIRKIGNEFGATTGRPRQCNWTNWDTVKKACRINGVNHLVVNKLDVLREVGQWKIYHNNSLINLNSENEFKNFIIQECNKEYINVDFQYSPY